MTVLSVTEPPLGGGGGALTPVLGTRCKIQTLERWLSMRSRPQKGGAVTEPSTLRRVAVRGVLLCGGSSLGLSIAIISVLITITRVIISG